MSDLPHRLYSALRNRGFSEPEIETMTPREMVSQYAGWHLGNTSWGEEFFDLIEQLKGGEA